ncbi:hypothetical protein ACTXT7_017154 [Hymenolepis weldensis]
MEKKKSKEPRNIIIPKPPIPWSDGNQYKCGKILGFDRLGAVYECKNLANSTEKLAIKIYCKKDMRRFVKEVFHISKLQNCPNVITLYGILERCQECKLSGIR